MKKTLRIAGIMLVLVLVTSCFVGSTFAKYVTRDNGSDTARVAKWGVTVLTKGTLFGAHYTATTGDTIASSYTGSVDSTSSWAADDTKIVAPGTKSDQGVTVAFAGIPEVSGIIDVATDSQDIFLAANTYGTIIPVTGVTADNFDDFDANGLYYLDGTTYTQAAAFADNASGNWFVIHDVVEVAADYYPITWALNNNGTADAAAARGATALSTKLAALVPADDFAFNSLTNLASSSVIGSKTLSWSWAFEGQNDGADTILGNIAANNAAAVPVKLDDGAIADGDAEFVALETTDYSINVSVSYTITITQVN